MHLKSIVILAVITYLINCHSVLGDPDPAKNVESSGNAKRQESRSRGETKFLLTKPTVKNKKYQVTSPTTTTGSPQIAGHCPTLEEMNKNSNYCIDDHNGKKIVSN